MDGTNELVARLEERLKASEKALELANNNMCERLEGMNEFRELLRNQAATFVTRVELDAKLDGIEKGKRDNIALLLSLLGILIAVFSIVK